MGAWKCTKCNTVQGGTNKPLFGVCNKGGKHTWVVYDSMAKPQLYQCGKCGTITSTKSKPNTGNCNKGGGHSWRKYQ